MYVIASLGAIVRNPAWDVVVVLFFLVAGFIGGSMGGGRVKLLSMLFANYIALFIAPLMFGLLDAYQVAKGNPSRNIVIYFILLGVLFLLFGRKIFGGLGRGGFKWWQAFLISFLTVGLFVAGSLNMLSFAGIVEFSPFILSMFAGKSAYLFWSLMPLLGLFLLPRGK